MRLAHWFVERRRQAAMIEVVKQDAIDGTTPCPINAAPSAAERTSGCERTEPRRQGARANQGSWQGSRSEPRSLGDALGKGAREVVRALEAVDLGKMAESPPFKLPFGRWAHNQVAQQIERSYARAQWHGGSAFRRPIGE